MSEITGFWIQMRRPSGDGDPGEAEHGYYSFVDGFVTLTDETGVPLRRGRSQAITNVRGARDVPLWSAAVLAENDPKQIAARLLKSKVLSEKNGGGFNRKIYYPNVGRA